MKHLIFAVIAIFLLFVVSFITRLVHVAKVSVQVVDEEGRPVEGAAVTRGRWAVGQALTIG